MSTNVSSPIQAASKRRQARTVDDDEEDDGLFDSFHPNGYARDSFVVDDDDDDDGFEPVRVGSSKMKPPRRRELAPPIGSDADVMATLSPRHRSVVHDFVMNAKELGKSIMFNKNLRGQPFSDTILREIMIRKVRTTAEMLRIPGIKPDMVRLHGNAFLEMAQNLVALLLDGKEVDGQDDEESSGDEDDEDEERPLDPNHEVVIDLCGSDPDTEYGSSVDLDEDDEEEAEDQDMSSHFFQQPSRPLPSISRDVQAFNDKFKMTQKDKPQVAKPASKPAASWGGKRQSRGKKGFKSKSAAGGSRKVRKKSAGPSTGAPKRNGGSRAGSGSYFAGGGGGSGIGMMPC